MSIVRQDFRSKLSGEKGESMNTVLEKIKKMGIVPVVVIENEKDAVPLADALCNGGLACAEVTFRTAAAGWSRNRTHCRAGRPCCSGRC